ncbi:hypothetical protein [Streptomyces sp. NPDC001781]
MPASGREPVDGGTTHAARLAAPDPDRLTPLLLETARHLFEDHHRALIQALRAAGATP